MKAKSGFFLKIGIFGMIAGVLILAFGVVKVEAISYNGSSTYQRPDIIDNSGTTVAVNYVNCADCSYQYHYYYDDGFGIIYYKTNVFLKVNTSISYSPFFVQLVNSNAGGSVVNVMDYYYSGYSLYSQVWHQPIDTPHYDQAVLDFSGWTSSGSLPNDVVVAIETSFIQDGTGTSQSLNLFSQKYFIYNNSGALLAKSYQYFTGAGLNYDEDYGFILVSGNYSPHSTLDLNAIHYSQPTADIFTMAFITGSYDYKSQTLVDFIREGYSGSMVQYSAMDFYGSLGEYNNLDSSSGSTSGTGTDYFADCTSFLDVGCYIKGLWNGITDTISGWFDSLFPSVSWTSAYTTGCSSSGSTATGSNLTGSGLSYIQKLQTFLLVVIPLSPPEGTEYCLIGGFTGTLAYQGLIPEESRNQMPGYGTMFDVMFLILMGYILIASIVKHGGIHINTEGDHWHLPEEILTQRESFKYDVKPQKRSPIKTHIEKPDLFHKKESFTYKGK